MRRPRPDRATRGQGRVSRRCGPGAGIHGVLLVDKPVGPTSHDVVGWVRRVLGTRRVGHCGTLDPAASGLLVMAIGAATRLVPLLTDVDKTYSAIFALGRSTASGDVEGSTVATAEVPPGALDGAGRALSAMTGDLDLAPPAYSAVKIDGERAHARARRGELVELPLRRMSVRRVDEVAPVVGEDPAIGARIVVSKGTYIRSIAEELGRRIGVPVHLGALRRLASGRLDVDAPAVLRPQAIPAEGTRTGWWIDIPGVDVPHAARGALIELGDPVALASLLDVPIVSLAPGAEAARRLCMGQGLSLAEVGGDPPSAGRVGLLARSPDGQVTHLVLARVDLQEAPRLAPERVLALGAGVEDDSTRGA